MAESITLKFGDKTFTVRPLTLGQLRAIGIGAAQTLAKPADPLAAEANFYDATIGILSAALSRDNPEMTAETVSGLETDFKGLVDARNAILRLSGLLSGEAPAPATESTGA